jgi:hypothetical protein
VPDVKIMAFVCFEANPAKLTGWRRYLTGLFFATRAINENHQTSSWSSFGPCGHGRSSPSELGTFQSVHTSCIRRFLVLPPSKSDGQGLDQWACFRNVKYT